MLLVNARVAESATESSRRNIKLSGPHDRERIDLSGCLLLPGLINAHDHLEFNLFPPLGRRWYANATEWARDIYRPEEPPVREHLRVPKSLRLFWGGMKNLLSGVTTVVHHNPYEPDIFGESFPVHVVRRCGWAHSLVFSPDVAERYRQTPARRPFIIHAGEGTDGVARSELRQLENLGVLGPRTVLVHGIGFDEPGLRLIAARRASLVWCPASNLATYGNTLRIESVPTDVSIALGTDSAISGSGDMIDELRAALACGASRRAVYDMVTRNAARVLRMSGMRRETGASGNVVAVPDTGRTPAEALEDLRPEMVIVGGRIRLISARMKERVSPASLGTLHSIKLENRGEWFTPFDIPARLRAVQQILGSEVRLAGRRILE